MSKKVRKKIAERKKRKRPDSDEEEEREELEKKRLKKEEEAKKNNNLTKFDFDALESNYNQNLVIEKNLWPNTPAEGYELTEELKLARKSIGVNVKGNTQFCPPPITCIDDPNLPSVFKKYFQLKEINSPTPIQQQSWPAILSGNNTLGIAPTGSGKTLAYLLPAVEYVRNQIEKNEQNNIENKGDILPTCLILVPTRELAIQIQQVTKSLKSITNISCGILYGGINKEEQITNIKVLGNSMKILVATPGRLLDILINNKKNEELELKNSKNIKEKKFDNNGKNYNKNILENNLKLLKNNDKKILLTDISYVILDEADRMLSLGFYDQIDTILKLIHPEKQTLLFSATFPGRLRELSEKWCPNSCIIRCNTFEVNDLGPNVKKIKENEEKPKNNDEKKEEKKEVKDDDETDEKSEEKSKDIQVEDNSAKISAALSSISVSSTILQKIHICAPHKRPRLLLKFIERIRKKEKELKIRQAGPLIIFCNKISTLKGVISLLDRHQILSVPLHGQLQQNIREENLNALKSVSFLSNILKFFII